MRKEALLLAIALLGLLCLNVHAELSDAEWAAMKKRALERPRLVIYDNDGDDVNYHPGEPTIEAIQAKRTTWLPKYPVNTLVYCVNGSTFQMHVPTENGELADFEWPANDKDAAAIGSVNAVKWLAEHGHDIIQLHMDYARAHGIEFFAEFRFNDTHDHNDSPATPCPYFPRFKREHPEFLIGSYEHQPPYATWTSYDFTHKEIRDKFVALVTEVAEKYEVDGIFIDFFRWLGIFKSVAWGGTASAEEVEMLSDMFRRIRTATEAIGRRRGRPILLAVRCADSPEYCLASGFDWEGLMAEGVFDMVFPAGNDHFEPWGNSVALCHKYGVKCYPSIDMPSFERHPYIRARDAREAYWAREAAAYQAGADGIYYYNLFSESIVANLMPPGYGALQLKNKRYYISPLCFNGWITIEGTLANGDRLCQLPQLFPGRPYTMQAGATKDFRMEIGDDLAALQRAGVPVRVSATLIADGDASAIKISSNGVPWRYCGTYKDKHAYEVPLEALRPGLNELHFVSKAMAAKPQWRQIMAGDVLLQGAKQPPWRRLFYPALDNRNNESIVDGAYRIRDTGGGKPCLFYPIDDGASHDGVDLAFEARVEASDDPLGAMVRVAGAGKVEIVTLQPGKVGLYYAGKTATLDAEKFHDYRVQLTHDKITVYADGKALLEAEAVMSSDAPKSYVSGNAYGNHGLNDSSIFIGSMADEGQGISLWRHVRLSRDPASVVMHDCIVDVKLDGAAAPAPDVVWQKTTTEDTTLSVGNYAYHAYPAIGECDLELPPDSEAHICLSSGGLFVSFNVYGNGILAEAGSIAPLPPAQGTARRIRIELDDHGATNVFVDGAFCTSITADNVSIALKDDPAMAKLNTESNGLLRNSGLIVRPTGSAKVQALRVSEYPEYK